MIGAQVVCENVPRARAQAKRDWQTLTAKVLHCLVLRAHQKGESLYGTLLFTENCTEETRKSKIGKRNVLMYVCFSSLRSSTEESVESNRIDFPEESLMK